VRQENDIIWNVKDGLKKRGPKKCQIFHERWFELYNNGHLYYFKNRNSEPIGYIDMKQAFGLQSKELSFKIETRQKIYNFKCLSNKQLVCWTTHLKIYAAL